MGKLSGKELRELDEALRDAFELPEFKRMLRFELDLRLDDISAASGDYRARVYEVLTYTEARNLTLNLVKGAWRTNRTNPKLLFLAQKYGIAIQTPDKRSLEKLIHEENISFDINVFSATIGQIAGRVCRVEIHGQPQGTGFLVRSDIVLTNHHVVSQVIDGVVSPSALSFRFDYMSDPHGITINPGVVVGPDATSDWCITHSPHSAVDTLTEQEKPYLPQKNELDFALIQLEDSIGDQSLSDDPLSPLRGAISLPVKKDPYDFSLNKVLFIPQHPLGRPMKLTVNTYRHTNGNGTRFTYFNDTEPGSSGSPVFNGNWELVGLHHSGDPGSNPEYNEGIPIHEIIRFLDEEGFLYQIAET